MPALAGTRRRPRARRRALLLLAVGLPVLAAIPFAQRLADYAEQRYGPPARERVVAWRGLIASVAGATETERLDRVNRFFNRLRFVSDADHWGLPDYWATPLEMLGTRGGDCEDFSIAKYFTLREMGVPDERLRITYVRALSLGQAHMVLAYYASPRADPLILDNLVDEVRSGSSRTDLEPVYSFNGDGLWLARERGRRVGDARGVRLWRELRARMRTELEPPRLRTASAVEPESRR